MAVSCMRNASGHNYRNSSFIVDVALGQIPRSTERFLVPYKVLNPESFFNIWNRLSVSSFIHAIYNFRKNNPVFGPVLAQPVHTCTSCAKKISHQLKAVAKS